MGRISLAQQQTVRARQPHATPDSQHSRDPAVLPFRSEFSRRRASVCSALVGLADGWRTLEIRDEASWAAYAADAAMSLTRHLVAHAVSVHAAMIESGYPSSADDVSTDYELARSLEDPGGQDDWADDFADDSSDDSADGCAAAAAESAADGVLLAFVGVINALAADDADADLDDVAGVVSAADGAGTTLDVTGSRQTSRHGVRQVS